MLDSRLKTQIETRAREFWNKEIETPFFTKVAQGSEIGHRIADLVSDKTTGLLAVEFTATFQRNKKGNKVPRSMGDIWLSNSEIFHPINVKASVSENNGGQPNMVSLKKLLSALLEYRIDSYYLLFVKISRNTKQQLESDVHFVDMLDYLDFITFDSGPGQIMLKSNAFFQARERGFVPTNQPLSYKVNKLVELLEDGERRLARNRRKGLKLFRIASSHYDPNHHIVTPEAQRKFNLQ